jgi:hypothetical protein
MNQLTIDGGRGFYIPIELQTVSKLIKDYYDAYPEQAHRHVIGRAIVDKILAQPRCEGLIIYPALNEEGQRTLVYGGIDADGRPITKIPVVAPDGSPRLQEAIIADRAGPADPDAPDTGW